MDAKFAPITADDFNKKGKSNGADQQARVHDAASLRTKTFEPLKYIVEGYIVEGCTLLAGRPKIGKSWLMLDVGIAVGGGRYCLGDIKCQQGDVLYLALEDNERRLQARITKLLGYATEWPTSFHYATEWPRAHQGGIEDIQRWIGSVKKPRLVVIDVLAKFRAPRRKDQQPYESDYEAIQALQTLSSAARVGLVIVHHLRKGTEADDPFEKVSGTFGLTGGADTALILDRSGQGTTLYGRGRDIEEIEKAIAFDKTTCRWTIIGDAMEVRVTEERAKILTVLIEAGEPIRNRDIAIRTGMSQNNVDQLLFKMALEGQVTKTKRGTYEPCTPDKEDKEVRIDQ